VLRGNDSGSYRVLFRMVSASTDIDKDGKEQKSPEKTDLAMFDMDDMGNMTELFDSFGYSADPKLDLPPLPADAKQLANGWHSDGRFGSRLHLQTLPESNATDFVFSVEEDTPFNVVYALENHRVMTFDRQRGLIVKMESTDKQGWGVKSEGSSEFKLVNVQMRDADWATKLNADAEQFFKALAKLNRAASADDATLDQFDQAVTALKEARLAAETPEFQQQLDQQLWKNLAYHDAIEERCKQREALLGQAAEDFKTTDLDDKPQALADYRGKVVLLDFWYRGCGWCIRSMPALKKVAEHYAGQPVAVLGMNTDHDLDDAKFVVDKLGLNYTNLKAEGLPEKFKVHGFPTLIMIDQAGKIRGVHVGWSPTLEHDLVKKIDGLLAENQ